jgi:serine protease Do
VPIGSTAIAIGNPSAGGLSATSGIVSVDSEHIVMKAVDELTNVAFRVQRTDSAINSGNSGGGLFNSSGELIGIVNAKINSSEIENIGYAIPGNIAIGAAQNIIDNCDGVNIDKIQKPILGVTVRIADSSAINADNQLLVRIVNKIVVDSFSADSIAFLSGMKVGDKLINVQIKGTKYTIDRLFILSDLLFDVKEDETIIITVERMVGEVATIVPISIGITPGSITAIE